jgi:CheY-like chemotaxis protein
MPCERHSVKKGGSKRFLGMDTDLESRRNSAPAEALHRLRSSLARLRGELELLELDNRPPGREVFVALDEAFEWLGRVEAASLGPSVRVVLADDDARLSELTASRLRRLGFHVEAVADLASALEKIRAGDRLVVDYGLISDAAALDVERIAAEGRMIVVSGSVAEVDRNRALALGAAAYLVKPVEMTELAQLLRAPAAEQR